MELRANNLSSYVQVAAGIPADTTESPVSLANLVALNWAQASVRMQACDIQGTCIASNEQSLVSVLASAVGYFKASNTGPGDHFGSSVALSADGDTLAVGAPGESSNSSTGNQLNNSTPYAGAVYVFKRIVFARGPSGYIWSQQAYLKAPNPNAEDNFGDVLALSADGRTLAVGAPGESSGANGINNNQADNSAALAGAVYVFTRSGSGWSYQAYLKASNSDAGDGFGSAVALSGDGNTLAVGALGEGSIATGIGGDQADNSAFGAGAVYVFSRNAGNWKQRDYIKASNTDAGDLFGRSVTLSADGSTLAVSATEEDSRTNGNSGGGAVYIFARIVIGRGPDNYVWGQQAYITASNSGSTSGFGNAVALSANGHTLAVSAINESGGVPGINGDQSNSERYFSGAVYIVTRTNKVWTQQAYIKASNPDAEDRFGLGLALSADGKTLAVGAVLEASNATGVNLGNQNDNSIPNSGAVYVFAFDDGAWAQRAYVKRPNAGVNRSFGRCVALSANGSTLAVGASEDSNATGIGGDRSNNLAPDSGVVYLY
jgi:hypothetical protein